MHVGRRLYALILHPRFCHRLTGILNRIAKLTRRVAENVITVLVEQLQFCSGAPKVPSRLRGQERSQN